MRDINGYIYFTKGIYIYKNQFSEWALSSKLENVHLEIFETQKEAINYALELGAKFLDFEALTGEKLELLKGFYSHLYCATFDNCSFDGHFWIDQLDSLHISWFVQNGVSVLAQKRESNFKYLTPQIEKVWCEWVEFFNSKEAA